jgi:hypothetical protein
MSYATAATGEEPDHADEVLEEIRQAISASDSDLKEARRRRDLVLNIAATFNGVLRTFKSGSVAHEDVNNPVDDADGGAVLDRRVHTALGPDSEAEEGPEEIMAAVRDHVMPMVRETYPEAKGRLIKRAILIKFNAPNSDDVDPSVDLVVALTRRDEDGLWIPNRDSDSWDASDPEEHTRLLTAEPKALRVHRARVIRMAKAAIKHDSTPALISFNIEALAFAHITRADTLGASLQLFFERAAADIKVRLTDDPAGVSGTIKLPPGMTRDRSAKRLGFFADKVGEARENARDRAAVESALAELFPEELPNAERSARSNVADAIRRGDTGAMRRRLAIAPAAAIKSPRAYGDNGAST